MSRGGYLGEFELVVLLALARLDEPSYGMAIYDEIIATTGRDVSVHSVYVTLSRMEKKGFLSANLGEPSHGAGEARARKCYSLLAAGLAALRKSREMYDSLWAGVRLKAGAGGKP